MIKVRVAIDLTVEADKDTNGYISLYLTPEGVSYHAGDNTKVNAFTTELYPRVMLISPKPDNKPGANDDDDATNKTDIH